MTQNRPTCGNTNSLGQTSFTKGTKDQYGSCNFCTQTIHAPPETPIWQLSGHRQQVRICEQCLKIIYAAGAP